MENREMHRPRIFQPQQKLALLTRTRVTRYKPAVDAILRSSTSVRLVRELRRIRRDAMSLSPAACSIRVTKLPRSSLNL